MDSLIDIYINISTRLKQKMLSYGKNIKPGWSFAAMQSKVIWQCTVYVSSVVKEEYFVMHTT